MLLSICQIILLPCVTHLHTHHTTLKSISKATNAWYHINQNQPSFAHHHHLLRKWCIFFFFDAIIGLTLLTNTGLYLKFQIEDILTLKVTVLLMYYIYCTCVLSSTVIVFCVLDHSISFQYFKQMKPLLNFVLLYRFISDLIYVEKKVT
jgi:hypothetical protein